MTLSLILEFPLIEQSWSQAQVDKTLYNQGLGYVKKSTARRQGPSSATGRLVRPSDEASQAEYLPTPRPHSTRNGRSDFYDVLPST